MRLRIPTAVIIVVVSLAAVNTSPAPAQIEFAKSTIRVVPSADMKQPVARTSPIQQATPVEQPLSVAERTAAASPPKVPRASSEQYPVRQADFISAPAARPVASAPAPGRAPSMVNVYSSNNAQSTLSKMPRPTPVHTAASGALPKPVRGKPFQNVQSEPVISPYMNLYRNDTSAPNLPNYLTMVRPQMEQQQVSRQQTAEIQKLRAQLQNLSGGSAPNSGNMSAHAHYMDTAQFYRGTRR